MLMKNVLGKGMVFLFELENKVTYGQVLHNKQEYPC